MLIVDTYIYLFTVHNVMFTTNLCAVLFFIMRFKSGFCWMAKLTTGIVFILLYTNNYNFNISIGNRSEECDSLNYYFCKHIALITLEKGKSYQCFTSYHSQKVCKSLFLNNGILFVYFHVIVVYSITSISIIKTALTIESLSFFGSRIEPKLR